MIIDQNLKVLMDGLYDPNSNLSLLRMPAVRSPLMKIIWDKVTEDWQVFSNHPDDHWWHNVMLIIILPSIKHSPPNINESSLN